MTGDGGGVTSGPEHAFAALSRLETEARDAWMYLLLCRIEVWMGRGELWALVRRHEAHMLTLQESVQEPPD